MATLDTLYWPKPWGSATTVKYEDGVTDSMTYVTTVDDKLYVMSDQESCPYLTFPRDLSGVWRGDTSLTSFPRMYDYSGKEQSALYTWVFVNNIANAFRGTRLGGDAELSFIRLDNMDNAFSEIPTQFNVYFRDYWVTDRSQTINMSNVMRNCYYCSNIALDSMIYYAVKADNLSHAFENCWYARAGSGSISINAQGTSMCDYSFSQCRNINNVWLCVNNYSTSLNFRCAFQNMRNLDSLSFAYNSSYKGAPKIYDFQGMISRDKGCMAQYAPLDIWINCNGMSWWPDYMDNLTYQFWSETSGSETERSKTKNPVGTKKTIQSKIFGYYEGGSLKTVPITWTITEYTSQGVVFSNDAYKITVHQDSQIMIG